MPEDPPTTAPGEAGPDTPLTTGWLPGTPAEDNLVRRTVLAHAAWVETEARLTSRPARRSDRLAVNWIGDRGQFTNQALALQPLVDLAAAAAEIETVCPRPAPCCLFSPWPTGDLAPFGFELVGHPPLMVRWPGDTRRMAPTPPETSGATVAEVTTPEELIELERVLVEGFPLPGIELFEPGCVFPPAVLGDELRFWLVREGGRAVACAIGLAAAGMNLVELVATLPDARRRGHGARATWAVATLDPTLPAVLIASDDGRPVYERMGFVALERWTVWARASP